jgi:hypothetical protein
MKTTLICNGTFTTTGEPADGSSGNPEIDAFAMGMNEVSKGWSTIDAISRIVK